MEKFLLFVVSLSVVSTAYVVERNVKDYGAKGDGKTDDTKAIITALTQGRGTGQAYPHAKYPQSTRTPAYVFFPTGTYLVNDTLPIVYYTQMVGDETNIPTIKFVNDRDVDIRVLEAAGAWYTGANQENFFHQVRNFIVDMEACKRCTGLHWQVAQATSLRNVLFKAGKGSQNQGIWMENGSGGFMSDVTVEGGRYGLWVGNQQFTSRNLTIRDTSEAAIYLNWDWVWTFKGLNIENTPFGIQSATGAGSLVLQDSVFNNIGEAVVSSAFDVHGKTQVDGVVLHNVKVTKGSGSGIIVADTKGKAVLSTNGNARTITSWVQGYVWENSVTALKIMDLSARNPTIPTSLAPNGEFYQRIRPNFQDQPTLDVTTVGIIGDGKTDNAAKLNQILAENAHKKVLLFPYGQYVIGSTVTIPAGSRLVGRAWSVLLAHGDAFQDASNPQPMLKVGNSGDTGMVQMLDLLLSSKGPQPGAVLLQWNLKGSKAGEAGMWDVHFRVGGADGTDIRPTNCPKGDGSSAPAATCNGVHTLMHATTKSSLYMENVWGWTADHDLDEQHQLNVYTARGFLCESHGPIWMYGTAMEHNYLYNYNFDHAQNIYMSVIQTETPYYQPSKNTPFKRTMNSDPHYCTDKPTCDMAWALYIHNSKDIFIYGTGLYSFFNTWDQKCLQPTPVCQSDLANITGSSNVYMYAFNTYGSVYMLTATQPYSRASFSKSTFCSSSIVNLEAFGN